MRPLITCLVCLSALVGCGKAAATAPPPRPPVPVETATAELRDVPRRLLAIGSVAASALVAVRPQVTAILATVGFTEGATVAAGAVLFTLDDRAFAAAERQAGAERDRALAQLALARTEAARTADLVRQNLASTQQGEQAQAALAVAQAAAAAAEAALARARLELSFCTVTAPISGRTGAVGITPGNLAAAGSTTLVTIASTQPCQVGFSVPGSALPALRAAMARAPLSVAITAEDGGQAESGVLDLLDNQIDPATATVRLRATCPNAAGRLWPGQQCRVGLALGDDLGVVSVPGRAVQTGQNGPLVWVVAADRTVTTRAVVVERTVDGLAVISAGLAAGETVVSDGQVRLVAGASVIVATPATGQAPAR